jgi:hypothetical protein
LQRSKFRPFTYSITALGALLQEKRHLDPERFGGDEVESDNKAWSELGEKNRFQTPPAPLCWPWTTDRPISRFRFGLTWEKHHEETFV